MAGRDTKPNFNSKRFEQCGSDIMNLSGCTQIFGLFDIENNATLTICSGAGVGKVLTSDETGIATWKLPYVDTDFCSFDVSINPLVEVGESISGVQTFTWETTQPTNVSGNTICIDIVDGLRLGTNLDNDGIELLDTGTIANITPTMFSWKISANDINGDSLSNTVSKCSVYPIYYGKTTSTSRPVITNSLITTQYSGKDVIDSTNTVCVNFDSNNQWTWIAIPSVSSTKNRWSQGGFVQSEMLVTCSKYPDEQLISLTTSYWDSVSYKVYMSGFPATDGDVIEFRNS